MIRLGPLAFRAWRLWVMLGAFALGAILFLGTFLHFRGQSVSGFRADDPEAIGLRAKDAQIEIRQGRPEVARDRLIALRDEDPLNPMIHALLGQAYGELPDALPMAIASTRMALSLDPYFMNASYNLGCFYARLGQEAKAISALSRAVELGFGDRGALAQDGDLKGLMGDPRIQHFLEGGILPEATRFARMWADPPVATVGHPVDIVLEAWDLEAEAEGEGEVDLTYLGPGVSSTFLPIARTLSHLKGQGGAMGWRLRYRVTPMAPGRDGFGPISLKVAGRRVGVGLRGFVVEGPALPPGGPGLPRLDLRAFVSAPWEDVGEGRDGEPPSLRPIEGSGAWVRPHRALEVSPWPEEGPGALSLPKAEAVYHEWIIPEDDEPPRGFRSFALGDSPLKGARLSK